MAKADRKTLFWWRAVGMTILAGIGYACIIAFNWDRLVSMGAKADPTEYTDKDLLQCEPGTHQEKGRCVSNPVRPGTQAKAPAAAPAKK